MSLNLINPGKPIAVTLAFFVPVLVSGLFVQAAEVIIKYVHATKGIELEAMHG